MTTKSLPENRILRDYKILKIIDHTPTIRELVLRSITDLDLNFKAGQFIMLHVPQGEQKPALRAYSIASSDVEKRELRLIFKYVDEGKASKYVWELKGEETLKVTGPFGKIVFKNPPTENIFFLNTGTGITQHLSFIYSHFNQIQIKQARLLFGVRTQADIYLKSELEQIQKQFPFFSYDFVLSRPDQNWSGLTGYVQDHLHSLDYEHVPTTFYLCGNGAMIKATKKMLSESLNFSEENIVAEAFD